MIITMILERPSAGIRASSVQQSISTDNHWQLLDLSSITQYMYMCRDTFYTNIMVNILKILYDNIILFYM